MALNIRNTWAQKHFWEIILLYSILYNQKHHTTPHGVGSSG